MLFKKTPFTSQKKIPKLPYPLNTPLPPPFWKGRENVKKKQPTSSQETTQPTLKKREKKLTQPFL
jgi:hypothetical protein